MMNYDNLILDLMDRGLDQVQTGDGSEVIQVINAQPTASPWRRVEEPPKEDGWYILCFLSRWRNGNWWIPNSPDYWMPPLLQKEETK